MLCCGSLALAALVALWGWAYSKRSIHCGLCSQTIVKTRYFWKLEGKNVTVCPDCNRRLRSKISADAFRRRGW